MSVIDSLSLGGSTYSLRDNDGRAIIAGTESSTTSAHAYSTGDYFILNDTLYEATAAIAVGGTITVGTNCQATTVCGEVGELKSGFTALDDVVAEEIGENTTTTVTITYTDGKSIKQNNPKGSIIDSSNMSISQHIDVTGAKQYNAYYTGQNPYAYVAFYASDDTWMPLSGTADFGTVSASDSQQAVNIPSGAAYAILTTMTARKSVTLQLLSETQGAIYDAIDAKLNKDQGAANAGKFMVVGNDGNVAPKNVSLKQRPKYMRSWPTVPLLPEFNASFCWCSTILPSAWTGVDVVLTVSGSEDDTELTVSNITGGTLAELEAFDKWVGGVLTTDGKAYKVYNFKYKASGTIEIFPALDATVSGVTLATLMRDSGEDYVGLHLTEHGYKAYAYYLYHTNPKHCEISKYIAAFRPYLDGETSPLTKYGSATIYTDVYQQSRSYEYNDLYYRKNYRFQFSSGNSSSTSKTGVYWEVDLKGESGYFEAMLCPITGTFDVPQDLEVYVDVYIDGELVSQSVLTTKLAKRICVDYENAQTGKVDIYCNKWVNGTTSGFKISRLCWWVNEVDYGDMPLFPKGAKIAQEFDSWGTFYDGASGVALSTLHNDATGVTVPYENHSKGDQTTAWGMSWWFENILKYNPSIAITDFVINDTNSVNSASIPATIEGPDETEYDNKITDAEYLANQKVIIANALNNGIQPILMRACQPTYSGFTRYLIDGLAEQIT